MKKDIALLMQAWHYLGVSGDRRRGREEQQMNHTIILGAPDPEMQAIEQAVCRAAGCIVVYAMADGSRVHPGSAYRASALSAPVTGTVVAVECGGPAIPADAVVVDHHRPGDPGYGRPPAEYWGASSIGQVYALLGIAPTDDARLCAAADHCLAAAYRGECPGIDPDTLMAWRVASRAAFQRRGQEAVLADIEAARRYLRDALRRTPAAYWDAAVDRSYGSDTRDGEATYGPRPIEDWVTVGAPIPELPEAAAREGIAYVATVTERGRRKRVMGAASPEQVRAWMATCGLTEVYGDPSRGFAGGYL